MIRILKKLTLVNTVKHELFRGREKIFEEKWLILIKKICFQNYNCVSKGKLSDEDYMEVNIDLSGKKTVMAEDRFKNFVKQIR